MHTYSKWATMTKVVATSSCYALLNIFGLHFTLRAYLTHFLSAIMRHYNALASVSQWFPLKKGIANLANSKSSTLP